MRMMMLAANQKNAGLACATCHVDPKEGDYAFRKDARELAEKWFRVEPKK